MMSKIKNKLILGLLSVILLSSLCTFLTVRFSLRRDFNTLVESNDIEIAKTYSAALAEYYRETGSLNGINTRIEELRNTSYPDLAAPAPSSPEKKHSRDNEIPLIVTTPGGEPIYSGIRTRDTQKDLDHLKVSQGEEVTVDGVIIAYVFFKSMLFRDYNNQEAEFITAFTQSLGISVLFGIVLALILGTILAAYFAKPITTLDTAVKTITDGDTSTRVNISRNDEIGSLADSFNRMADKLQVTEHSRQTLLADIAHELRTPVSIIQANLEMLLEGVYRPDQDRLQSLYEETCIVTELISDLRSLSDLEVGKATVHPETLSLTALLYESCRKLKPLFEEKKITLDDTFYTEDIFVQGESDKLRQVFRNILGNAQKYTIADSTVSITVERKPGGKPHKESVRITISDEGEGVPEEGLEKIFERFYRVDLSRNRESGGRGLGLAISKKIIEAFNGTIGAYNREPRGLAVWIDLPIETPDESAVPNLAVLS